jgi:imidazolonepropionase-like amidohydrolase
MKYSLHAGSVFDGVSMSGPVTVHIADGTIVEVDTSGALPQDGREVIDLGAETCLLPGLIDCHVHLAFNAGPNAVTSLIEADDVELLDRMRSAARSAVLAGITTIRDLGDRSYLSLTLAEEIAQHPEKGPQILAAGPPLTTPGGHCWFFGGETEGADALRAAVRERHARGCAVIKIMASGGRMTAGSAPHESQYSLADLRVVVEEAHRLRLPVAAHAHGNAAIAAAVAAGVDTIEHMSFLTADGVDRDPALLSKVVESGVYISATLGHVGGMPEPIRQFFGDLEKTFVDLQQRGGKLVIGSDAGIGVAKPHNVLPYGPSELAGAGMPPLDALATVTSVAAQACGVADRKGRIAAGADADLLAVNGDPLEDLARLRDVKAVFRKGVRVR